MQISFGLLKFIGLICSLGIIICENYNQLRNAKNQPDNNWSSQLPASHSSSSTTATPVTVFEADVINVTVDDRVSNDAAANEAVAEVTGDGGLATADVSSTSAAPLTTTETPPATGSSATVVLKNLSNENMPSFSEWTQKRLEEKARKLQNSSDMKPNSSNANHVVRKTKLKSVNWKNYASPTCGAKVLDANSDSGNPNHIITASKDEYCLNKCKNAIWFIIELCEAIQIQVFELANFELYSSSPHEFELAISDRYQPKEWTILGNFSARNDHETQQFRTDSLLFSKYVRFVVRSHHGNEHYCTISHVRLFGISEIEALKKQDDDDDSSNEDDDDDDETVRRQNDDAANIENASSPQDFRTIAARSNNSIFSSAKIIVHSVVDKFKEILGIRQRLEQTQPNNLKHSNFRSRVCQTPKYRIEIESDNPNFNSVLEQVSCNYYRYQNQVEFGTRTVVLFDRLINSSCSRSYSSMLDVFVTDTVTMQTACYWHRVIKNEAVVNDTAIKLFDVLIAMDAIEPNAAQNKDQMISGVVGSGGGAIAEGMGSLMSGDSHAAINDQVAAQHDVFESAGGVAESNLNHNSDSLPHQLTIDNLTIAGDAFISTADTLSSHVPVSRAIDVFDVYRGHVQQNRESNQVCTRNSHIVIASAVPNPTASSNAPSATSGTPTGGNTTNGRSSSQPQPQESVFLRLSNRIKILEQNLSLSSQYLEELSQRYKKQVEDMQRHFDETLSSLRDKLSERDRSDESIRNRLFGLSRQINLINERTAVNWPQTLAFYAKMIISEVIITVICLCLFRMRWNRQNRLAAAANTTIEVIPDKGPIINYSRRKSVDALPKAGVTTLPLPFDAKTHHRRSSHEPQLILTRTTAQSDVDELDSRKFTSATQTLSKAAEKRRRRKLLKRNHSDQQEQKPDQRLEERQEFEIDMDTLKVFADERPVSCSSSASSPSSPSSHNNENETVSAVEKQSVANATAAATVPLTVGHVKAVPLLERDSNRAMTKTSSFKVKTTAFAAAAAAHVSGHKRNNKKAVNVCKKDGLSSSGAVRTDVSSTASTTTGLMKFIRKVF